MADTNQSATSGANKTAAAKTAAKTSTTKKATTKRATAKKATAKKATAKKATAKKATAKKATAKKSASKKTTAKKSPARKPAAKRSATTKAAKKTVAKRTVTSSPSSRAAATGRAVVARAAAATQGPVDAGRALVERAGERVADAGRAVLTPSTRFFARAPIRAQAMVADSEALHGLADKVLQSESGRSGPVGEVVDDFKTLGRLVAAYARGDYRDIPLDSLVVVIAGLVYVVSPIDLIPDAVPVAGYADDAVAVGFVIRQVHHELAAFREWEATSPSNG
jgi:uncharacterized membrane protein YkvA (DUF1232 family)